MSLLLLRVWLWCSSSTAGNGPTTGRSALRPRSLADMYRNAASPSIGLVLVLNTIYIVSFSSLFFMAEGLFDHAASAT
jgi:hypothetical protein